MNCYIMEIYGRHAIKYKRRMIKMKHKGIFIIGLYLAFNFLLIVYQVVAALVFGLSQEDEMAQFIILNFLADIGVIIAIIAVNRKSIRQGLNEELSDRKAMLHHLFILFYMFLITALAMFLSSALIYNLGLVSQNQESLMESQQLNPVLMNIQIVLLAPIIEETIFRGVIFTWLYKKMKWGAYFVSAFIFGFLHIWIQMLTSGPAAFLVILPYFLLGLGLAITYKRTKLLIYPIIIHVLWNLIGILF